MAPSQITLAEVDQAEADLVAAKKGRKPHKAQAQALASLRQAWREQEEAAGRRVGLVSIGGK